MFKGTKGAPQMILALAQGRRVRKSKQQTNRKGDALMNNQTPIQPTSGQIAICAYLIWEEEGRPHGWHEAHWLQAERQLKLDCTQDARVQRRPDGAAPAELAAVKPFRPKRRSNSNRREVVAA
jgi:hypothetical protein